MELQTLALDCKHCSVKVFPYIQVAEIMLSKVSAQKINFRQDLLH